MVTLLATTSAAPSPATTREAMGVRRHDDGQRGAPEEGVTDVAFAALLAVTRTATGLAEGGFSGKTSPNQMFEPSRPDGEGGKARFAQDARADVQGSIDQGRHDRASISARRTASIGQTSDTPMTSSGELSGRGFEKAGQGQSQAVGTDGPAGRVSGAPTRLLSVTESVSAVTDKAAAHSATRTPPATPIDAGTSNMANAAASERAAAVAVRPTGTAPGSQVETPASRVAQLLGSGKLSGVESARAPAAPTAAGQTGAQQRAVPKNPTPPQPTGQTARQAASSRGESVSSAERTPFDEFVRSIRLRTTPRISSARMQLDPPELGRVDVTVKVTGEKIELDLRAHSTAARHLLQGHAAQLTAALERHGVIVERFDVSMTPTDESAHQPAGDAASDTPTFQARNDSSETALSSTHRAPVDEEDALVMEDQGPMEWAASETRLDIRI